MCRGFVNKSKYDEESFVGKSTGERGGDNGF